MLIVLHCTCQSSKKKLLLPILLLPILLLLLLVLLLWLNACPRDVCWWLSQCRMPSLSLFYVAGLTTRPISTATMSRSTTWTSAAPDNWKRLDQRCTPRTSGRLTTASGSRVRLPASTPSSWRFMTEPTTRPGLDSSLTTTHAPKWQVATRNRNLSLFARTPAAKDFRCSYPAAIWTVEAFRLLASVSSLKRTISQFSYRSWCIYRSI